MSPMQAICLTALADKTVPNGELCVGFAVIERAIGLARSDVKRSVRALFRKGFAEFHKGLTTEDGEFAGAGYCITPAGYMALLKCTIVVDRTSTVSSIPDDELLRRAVMSDRAVKSGGRYRWNAIMERFQLGSTYSQQLCKRFGVDPDEMVRR
jgi:hypothetical protein